MKKKKNLRIALGLLLTSASALTLVACSKPNETTLESNISTPSSESEKTSKIEANDNIDFTKFETVNPGYGNIGSYKQIELNVKSKKSNLKIQGFLNVPSNFDSSKQYPLAIMSHGIAGSVTTYDQNYVAYFLEKGIICYTYFFCGGGSPTTSPDSTTHLATKMMSESEGDSKDMSLLTEREDLLSVFDEISKKSFIDKSKIVLMGESMGGAVTGITAPMLKDKIAGEILCYPALPLMEGALETYVRYDKIPNELYRNGLTLTKDKFYKDIKDLNLYEETAKYTNKVCLLHGTADGSVDISSSEKLKGMLNSVEYTVIENGAHGFKDKTLAPAVKAIMKYLKNIGIINDENINVGEKSGTFVTNHPQVEPTQSEINTGPQIKLETSESAVELFRTTSLTSGWMGTADLVFYSDGTVQGVTKRAPKKLGEWRYIDGKITIGIEGNGIRYSSSNEDYTKLLLNLGWLGAQFKFEINETDFITSLNHNHGKVDRFDWIGQY